MRILLLFTASMLSLVTEAQDVINQVSKWSVGIHASPDYAFRTLFIREPDDSSTDIFNSRQDIEQAKLGYSYGFRLNRELSKHWSLETGLVLSNKGYETVKLNLTYGSIIDPRNWSQYYYEPDPTSQLQFRYSFYYIGLPIQAVFRVGEKKLSFNTSAGLSFNSLLAKQISTMRHKQSGGVEQNKSTYEYDFNKFGIDALGAVAVSYRIKNRIRIQGGPRVNYSLTDLIDAPITARLWSAGMDFAAYFSLRSK